MTNKRCIYIGAIFMTLVLFSSCDYMHKVYLQGEVTDVSGQRLPGAVVKVRGTEFEDLTNGVGRYFFGVTTGNLQLEFVKTGYTPGRMEITVDSLGRVEAPTIALWPLPVGEGVYYCKNYRYYEAARPRPNRYQVKDMGEMWGTPVNPDLIIPWTDPETHTEGNPPFMIGHKMPAYDARMHKMQKVKAALIQTQVRQHVETDKKQEMQYPEEIWIAEQIIAIYSRVLDEQEKLLVELKATSPLEPGVYAIHWGALEGYDSIDPRIFMFELQAPTPEVEEEGEGESAAGSEGEPSGIE